MLKKIILVLAVLVLVLGVYISRQPEDFRITRTAIMSASPADIFAHVNDLHKWDAWSPWAKLDPNAVNSFDGPATGVGSSMSWSGNSDVGSGRMTITQSRPDELVQARLDFLKPFEATSMSEFTFQAAGDQTTVTWSMFGKNNFLSKAMRVFVDCEKMVGDQFEQGLTQLKSVVEKK